jgi:hypothetical protein
MLSLLYVSRSTLTEAESEQHLQQIVSTAVERNLRSGVTGALVYTGREFAQVLEGANAAVGHIMGSVILDCRHSDIRIVEVEPIATRFFPNWGMTRITPSTSIQLAIDAIRHASSDTELAYSSERLTSWMREGASARV